MAIPLVLAFNVTELNAVLYPLMGGDTRPPIHWVWYWYRYWLDHEQIVLFNAVERPMDTDYTHVHVGHPLEQWVHQTLWRSVRVPPHYYEAFVSELVINETSLVLTLACPEELYHAPNPPHRDDGPYAL